MRFLTNILNSVICTIYGHSKIKLDSVQCGELKSRQKELQFRALEKPSIASREALNCKSAAELVEGIKCGYWTASDIIHGWCWKIREYDIKANCVSEYNFESALERARLLDLYYAKSGYLIGPMHGVPIAVSDEIHVKGLDCSLGCRCGVLNPSIKNSITVDQLESLGAIIICKTRVPWHLLFSEVVCPVFQSMKSDIPNISHGGQGGALTQVISKGNCLLGIGTDQMGGIRIPSSMSTFSLKPTSTRNSSSAESSTLKLIPSVTSFSAATLQDLIFITQNLFSQSALEMDPFVPPVPLEKISSSSNETLTIGIYMDDELIRASPSVRRAVCNAALTLSEMGHTIVKFQAPITKKAQEIITKSLESHKSNYGCILSDIHLINPYIQSLFSAYSAIRIPKIIKGSFGWLLGYLLNDETLKSIALACLKSNQAKEPQNLINLQQERDEYIRIFDKEWKSALVDIVICPVHALPPMPALSWPYTWIGSIYSTIFNFIDYPVGVIPAVTTVIQEDRIRNTLQYAHNNQYIATPSRDFNFLGVLAYEELNSQLDKGSIIGAPVGIQIVGRPYQEQLILKAMKIIDQNL